MDENRFEVVSVDYDVSSISSFKIDVLLSSQSIYFSAEMFRAGLDNKVKLQKVYSDYYICLLVNTLIVEKYSRFL